MDARDMLPAAEITVLDAMSFEQQLEGQAFFIGILYGSAFLIGLFLLIGFTLRIQREPLSWGPSLETLAARPWNMTGVGVVVLPLLTIQFLFYLVMYYLRGTIDYEEGRSEKIFLIVQSLLFHWA